MTRTLNRPAQLPDAHPEGNASRLEMIEQQRREREQLARQTGDPRVIRAVRAGAQYVNLYQPPSAAEQLNTADGIRGLSVRLQQEFRTQDTVSKKTLEDQLLTNIPDKLQPAITQMIDALTEPPDPEASKRSPKHRYASILSNGGMTVNFKTIAQDRETLKRLSVTNPELQRIDAALEEYAEQDRDQKIVVDWKKATSNSRTTTALKEMGRISLVLGAGFLGALSLPMAIVHKRGYWAPLLYGFTAFAAAKPKEVKNFFLGTKYEAVLTQMDKTVNQQWFRDVLHDYGIQGKEWQLFVESVMASPRSTQKFLAEFNKTRGNPEKQTEVINAYLDASGLTGEARTSLERMIRDGRIAGFAKALMGTTNRDARQVINDYVAWGAERYRTVAEARKEEAGTRFAGLQKDEKAEDYAVA